MDKLKSEYRSFNKAHQNRTNILFHVFCGTIYTSSLLLLIPFNYSYLTMFFVLLTALTLGIETAIISGVLLFIGINLMRRLKANVSLLFIMVSFYLLPEASHYFTGEKPLLKLEDIGITDILINIFTLLPFSVKTLLHSS